MATYQSKFTGEEIDAKLDQVGQAASADVLGGIKVGEGLEITAEGVLNALGGSIGSNLTITTLFEGEATQIGNYELTDNIHNYDFILITCFQSTDKHKNFRLGSTLLQPSQCPTPPSDNPNIPYWTASIYSPSDEAKNQFVQGHFGEGSTMYIAAVYTSWTETTRYAGVSKVVGIKLNSGGSSSSVTKKATLWEGELGTEGETITLNDSIENYDFIYVEACVTGGEIKGAIATSLLDVNTIEESVDNTYMIYTSAGTSHWYRVGFAFTDMTTLKLMKTTVNSTAWSNPRISKVIGLKAGGGSSSSGGNYSTEEQKIGTWIDGKPLYQKTITGYKTPITKTNGTVARTDIDLSDLPIDMLVDINIMIRSATVAMAPTLYGNTYYGIQAYYQIAQKQLVINNTSTGYTERDLYITIKYTKLTD